MTFLFLFTALIGLCNRYSRCPSTIRTFSTSFFLFPIYSDFEFYFESILAFDPSLTWKIVFLFQYPDVLPRQSGKWNHFCYFISIYAKLLFCFSLHRKLQIELPGPLITQTGSFQIILSQPIPNPPSKTSSPVAQNDRRTNFLNNFFTVNNVYRSTRMSYVDFYHLTLCL